VQVVPGRRYSTDTRPQARQRRQRATTWGLGIRIGLEGDLRTAAVAGERTVEPVDVPGAVPGDPKEPDPRRRLRTRRLAGAEEEGCQRVGGDAVGDVGEKGGHPAALFAKPEPALVLAIAQDFPGQPAATLACARWRHLFLVH
jgi:hypothetical protein